MLGAAELEKSLVVAVIDAKGPDMLNLKSGACDTSRPVRCAVLALIARACVHPLRNLGGDVAGLGRLVVFRNLVGTRFCFR